MDPLTQLIGLLRPRSLLWKQMVAAGDWAIDFPANDGAVFCLIGAGSCDLRIEGRPPRRLAQGDFLLLTGPPDWSLSNGEPTEAVDYRTLHARAEAGPAVLGQDQAGPRTETFGGRFTFDTDNAALLGGLMPAIVEIDAQDGGAARLRAVLGLIGDEAVSRRPGRGLVLERLLEIMLVESIRNGPEQAVDSRGLLAGLADPRLAAALRALHADIRRRWTVADLAAAAGVSRSVFAERFSRAVGLPPLDYVLRWRMALAKDALRAGREPLIQIALASGYQSASAFSAAFTRTVGCPPSKYAADRAAALRAEA